jgi:hypothetical protein
VNEFADCVHSLEMKEILMLGESEFLKLDGVSIFLGTTVVPRRRPVRKAIRMLTDEASVTYRPKRGFILQVKLKGRLKEHFWSAKARFRVFFRNPEVIMAPSVELQRKPHQQAGALQFVFPK